MFTGKQLVWIHDTAQFMYDMLLVQIQEEPESADVAVESIWRAAAILDDHPNHLPLDWIPDHDTHMWLFGVCHVSAEVLREAIAESYDQAEKLEFMDDYETCISIRRALFTVH